MLRDMVIGMALGIVTETVARGLGLWTYRQPQTPILNVIGVFGFVMGGLTGLARAIGLLPACVLAALAGLAYEVANLRFLDWWYFPNQRLGFIRGHAAIVAVLAVLWGMVPVAIVTTQVVAPRLQRIGQPRQSRLEQLGQREQYWLKKLDAVQRKARYLESKLADVRRRKQYILDQQRVRRPGPTAATPPAP